MNLSSGEFQKVELLIEFVKVMANGLPKPYDPTPMIKKVKRLEKDLHMDLSAVMNCCPASGDIRDAKDFKPYIMAATDEIAKILQLEVKQIHD